MSVKVKVNAWSAATFLYLLASGVTWTSGVAGGASLAGRATVAEPIALLIMMFVAARALSQREATVRVPGEVSGILPLLTVFVIGAIVAALPGKAVFSIGVHLFGVLSAVGLVNVWCDDRMDPEQVVRRVLAIIMASTSILAGLGLIQFFVAPNLFPNSAFGGLSGTFRNTGQAGTYFSVMLGIIVPGMLSGLINRNLRNLVALAVVLVALVLTFKRAAIIGFGTGVFCLAVYMWSSQSKIDKKRGAALMAAMVALAPTIWFALEWSEGAVRGVAWRLEHKFSEGAIGRFSEGFATENIMAAWAAFKDSPLVGVGLANIGGEYTEKYEIHSTYFAVLAQNGLLGIIAYLWFLYILVSSIVRHTGGDVYGRFFQYFLPLLGGLFISWGYTYHLRKREFWILVAVIVMIKWAARRCERKRAQTVRNVPSLSEPVNTHGRSESDLVRS